ncbi:MAG: CHAT domain-containing protein [Cyanobacteria bacterium P01_G01_bin.54]
MARKRSLFSTALQSLLIGGAVLLSGFTPEGRSLLDAAQADYLQGNYAGAIEYLEPLLELTTQPHERAQILLNLAAAYLEVGNWSGAEGAIAQAQQILAANPQPTLQAALQETEGKLYFSLGRYDQAFRAWGQAAQGFGQLSKAREMHRNQLHQVRALEKLGQYRSAMQRVIPLYQVVQSEIYANTAFKAQVYQQFALMGRVIGEFPQTLGLAPAPKDEKRAEYLYQALLLLKTAEAIAHTTANPQLQAEIGLALGELEQVTYYWAKDSQERVSVPKTFPDVQRQYFNQAIAHYQSVAHSDSALATQAQLNLLNLTVDVFLSPPLDEETGITIADPIEFITPAPQIAASLATQTPNRDRSFAQINIAHRLLKYHHSKSELASQATFIEQLLINTLQAVNPAINSNRVCQGDFSQTTDSLVTAYSLAYLGELYEKQEQWAQAQACTEVALWLAEPLQDERLMYQVQWQLGRLLARAPKTHKQAVVMYESTIDTLDGIRADLVSLKQSEFRFSFRDEVEPVYRELMALLLTSEEVIATKQSSKTSGTDAEANLDRVTGVLEELQVATIEDYLRCDLSAGEQVSAEAVAAAAEENNTALIYPIYTQGRIEIILKYYQDDEEIVVHRLSTSITEAELDEKLTILRDDIEEDLTPHSSSLFGEVYDLLIKPIEADLQAHSPKTLVFALDRFFQNIPLAALHNGEKYLIEDYAIALNLGLPLYKNSQIPSPENLEILVAGTTTDFAIDLSDLPQVKFELDTIQKLFPNQVDVLAELEFVSTQIKDVISAKPFSIVHLATHGQFGSNPHDTFIVTRDAKLDLNDMTQILQQRSATVEDAIQLLVLSACQTAAGDRRAALGLAGITVQTGARSTIASLQIVGDASTALLMSELYKQFAQGNTSRAQALRQAQLAMLKRPDDGRRPNAWATFILVGSWQ